MYAIIETGGKQFKASPGKHLRVEKIEASQGESVTFERVMLIQQDGELSLGTPFIEGARVKATVVEQGRGRKVLVFKKKRRKQYRRTRGHRQSFTAVHIDDIELG